MLVIVGYPGLLSFCVVVYNAHVVRRVTEDVDELTELRARQRTFDGAYIRASLVCIGYALVILKIFSSTFAIFGLLFVGLSALLLLCSQLRRAKDKLDFSDNNLPVDADRSVGPSQRVWGKRKIRTAGWQVLIISTATLGVQAAILALVVKLDLWS